VQIIVETAAVAEDATISRSSPTDPAQAVACVDVGERWASKSWPVYKWKRFRFYLGDSRQARSQHACCVDGSANKEARGIAGLLAGPRGPARPHRVVHPEFPFEVVARSSSDNYHPTLNFLSQRLIGVARYRFTGVG
jgi:hypothetical protein